MSEQVLRFTKMQGLGNDFVVIDAIRQPFFADPDAIRRLADRNFGVGCDQVLLVEASDVADIDFRYRIFNADGSEVQQCGNGARCFARFVYEKGLCEREEIRVETVSGKLLLRRRPDGLVTVDMGVPRHEPAAIPVLFGQSSTEYSVDVEGQNVRFGAVSMGNPHAVIRVYDVERAPVETLGPKLERHAVFPERANIGFLQWVDRGRAKLRVFERGVGETLACGSGACAAVVIGIEWNLFDAEVLVELPGGALSIRWEGRGQPVLMTGPAVTVFEGEIKL